MPIITETIRRLARVELVSHIDPIPDADAIEKATIGGWSVVVKKNEFHPGDPVVFFEIDTALPLDNPLFAFLAARGSKTVGDRAYHVLKTARLRGTYSQGLALPLADVVAGFGIVLPGWGEAPPESFAGLDLTEQLGLGKWEPPLPVGNGEQAGPFLTTLARKSDAERIQNLGEAWAEICAHQWIATEKVDGSSATVGRDEDGQLRVMSRNWEIVDGDNTYWNVTHKYSELFEVLGVGEAVQFEIAGPGVQANPLGLGDVRPFVFGMFRGGVPVPMRDWPEAVRRWTVPVLDLPFPESPEAAIDQADGLMSAVNPAKRAEGIVWHEADATGLDVLDWRCVWKAVNNTYLLKAKD